MIRPPRVIITRSWPSRYSPSAVATSASACGADRVEVDLEAQVAGGVRQAAQMVVPGERLSVVEAHDLEDAVAADETLVRDGDDRLLGGHDPSVD